MHVRCPGSGYQAEIGHRDIPPPGCRHNVPQTGCDSSSTLSQKQLLHLQCHEIEKVFNRRKYSDQNTRLDNSKILCNLIVLLFSDNTESIENPENDYAVNYICSNKDLLNQLVQIIKETEDCKTCLYTIDILYNLLTKNTEGDKTTIKEIMNCPHYLNLLLESMYNIHLKFGDFQEYKEFFFDIHNKILQIITTTCDVKKCRNYVNIRDDVVCFIGQLVNLQPKHKNLVANLIIILKLICANRNYSDLLASKQFYHGLCYFCKFSQKFYAISLILKFMSRSSVSLNCMSQNEKIFNLILDLCMYNGKKIINKKSLMTTLYRISKTVYGYKYLSDIDNFNKLLYYFIRNEKFEISQHRIATIKAYTILNRSLKKVPLPSSQLNLDLNLHENMLEYDDCTTSDNSDAENDSEESEDEDEMDHDIAVDEKLKINAILSRSNTTDFLETKKYFIELLSDQIQPESLQIFENLNNLNMEESFGIIEQRVHRFKNINRQAFPDVLMLDTDTNQHFLNETTNYFSVENLVKKIQCDRGIIKNEYKSKIIYDLDKLLKANDNFQIIPSPNCFNFEELQNTNDEDNSLVFESRFECGNLRQVKQIDKFEYELLLSPDTQSEGGHQWFYFQISNTLSDTTYTFNIINYIKVNSQYNYGMQPVLFSVTDYIVNKIGWRRIGEKIIYYGNNYTDESGSKQYRTLSFSLEFPFGNDYVYLAYHYPYTYTRLMKMLLPISSHNKSKIYVRIDRLCYSIYSKNEVPLITITAAPNNYNSLNIPLHKRPLVFITARVHPGETNSSWIVEGIIKFLLNSTDEGANQAREHYIFKIIPMLNPEGVIYGNTRCGLTGVDLNRSWSKPNQTTNPEIFYCKKLLAYAKLQCNQPIFTYIDIHGHSRKKYFFFYGCNPKLSWIKEDAQIEDSKEALKMLPQVLQTLNPHFRLNYCKYKIQKNKEGTGRVVMWREFGIQQSYTLECSYCSGDNNLAFNTKMLTDIGSSIIVALSLIAHKVFESKSTLSSLGEKT